MTTYNQIWEEFKINCQTDDINLPQTDEGIYSLIRSAVKHFNNRMNDNITCNDATEMVSRDLTDDELIIIAHYIRLSFFENQLIYFSTTWQPFEKEVGVKNMRDVISAYKMLIDNEKQIIENIIMFSQDDYL